MHLLIGYFVHLTTTNILTKDRDGTDLVSPPLCYNGTVCLSFDYLLPGQTTLDILVQTGGQTSKVIALPSTQRWTATNVSLHGTANSKVCKHRRLGKGIFKHIQF